MRSIQMLIALLVLVFALASAKRLRAETGGKGKKQSVPRKGRFGDGDVMHILPIEEEDGGEDTSEEDGGMMHILPIEETPNKDRKAKQKGGKGGKAAGRKGKKEAGSKGGKAAGGKGGKGKVAKGRKGKNK